MNLACGLSSYTKIHTKKPMFGLLHVKNRAENSYITNEVIICTHIKLNYNNVTHSEYSDRRNYGLRALKEGIFI